MSNRLAEIKTNYEQIQERINKACQEAKREISEISLIAVTKTYPVEDIELLHDLGIQNVGENKDQDAAIKHSQVKNKFIWHFIGQLQSNKAKSVVNYADLIHSVDRVSLVKEIQKCAEKIGKKQDILIQVDLDQRGPDPSRGGIWPAELLDLADKIANSSNLNLKGLMSVAPVDDRAVDAFSRLFQIRSDFLKFHPEATVLSAGMSEDLEEAILSGATHLRIGSALLGQRPKIG